MCIIYVSASECVRAYNVYVCSFNHLFITVNYLLKYA